MSIPSNIFDTIGEQGQVQEFAGLYEKRMINDSEGRIQYLAVTPFPNAATDQPLFDVRKCEYDSNNFLSWYRLPDNGSGFKYTFDDIVSYFS